MQVVKRFGLLHIPDVSKARETKGIFVVNHELLRVLIEQFRMLAEDFRDVDRQWAVNEDRKARDFPSIDELMQHKYQLLRSAHREGRHDDLSSALIRTVHNVREFFPNGLDRLVGSVPTGALLDPVN